MTARQALVTGANGHLGFTVARQLLAKGWRVRCSVRDPADPGRSTHLRSAGLDDLVALDVRDGPTFRSVTAGVDTLFHVAATYRFWTEGPEADAAMIRDAREGATNAVRAAAAAGVRRLILTSSIVTLPLSDRRDGVADETMWQTDLRMPYMRAKTEAERDAWTLARDLGVDMVAILPGAILGPGFRRRTTSTDVVENAMLGGFRLGRPGTNCPAVDVRDVARAHVMAAELPCDGRLIVCNDHAPSFGDLIRAMRRVDPKVPPSLMALPDALLGIVPAVEALSARLIGTRRFVSPAFTATIRGRWWNYSNARAREVLGWRPELSLEDSLAATMARLREIRAEERGAA